eukprot:365018-Chlamydomonas_euryale.AAC.4
MWLLHPAVLARSRMPHCWSAGLCLWGQHCRTTCRHLSSASYRCATAPAFPIPVPAFMRGPPCRGPPGTTLPGWHPGSASALPSSQRWPWSPRSCRARSEAWAEPVPH